MTGHPLTGTIKMDAHFSVELEWNSFHRIGEIAGIVPDMPYYVFHLRDGRSPGVSPEELLIAAIGTCYSISFSDILHTFGLPQSLVAVRADGIIGLECGKARVTSVTVNPTIVGADMSRRKLYEQAAVAARDACLIGRSIRGNTSYVVGAVTLCERVE
jgi:osmotically inducible protein OsmC